MPQTSRNSAYQTLCAFWVNAVHIPVGSGCRHSDYEAVFFFTPTECRVGVGSSIGTQ